MQPVDIKRLGLILAVQAEIEGMKEENERQKQIGNVAPYTDINFQICADELRKIVNMQENEF